MSCECDLCERHRSIRRTIERRDVDELISLVQDLELHLDHAELDRDMCRGIFQCPTPYDREMLEQALAKLDEWKAPQQ